MKEKSVKCNGKKRREGWEIVTFCVTSNEKFNIKKKEKEKMKKKMARISIFWLGCNRKLPAQKRLQHNTKQCRSVLVLPNCMPTTYSTLIFLKNIPLFLIVQVFFFLSSVVPHLHFKTIFPPFYPIVLFFFPPKMHPPVNLDHSLKIFQNQYAFLWIRSSLFLNIKRFW